MKWLQLDNTIPIEAFDFDGNLLKLKTPYFFVCKKTKKVIKIFADEIDAEPTKFFWPEAEYDFTDGDLLSTLRNWMCTSPYWDRWFDWLLNDVKKALEDKSFGPSFEYFKDTFLIKWRIWSIITDRWNSPDNFQRVFELINKHALTAEEKEEQLKNIRRNYWLGTELSDVQVLQYYFREQIIDYVPCNNPLVQRFTGMDDSKIPNKAYAMDWWLDKVHDKMKSIWMKCNKDVSEIITSDCPLAVWFSDDSVNHVNNMIEYLSKKINELWQNYIARVSYTWVEEWISKIWKTLPDNVNRSTNGRVFSISCRD